MKKITKNILIATRVAIAIMNIKLNIIITPTTAAMPPPGVMTQLVVTSIHTNMTPAGATSILTNMTPAGAMSILTNMTPVGAMSILTNIAPVGVMSILTMHTKNIAANTAKPNYMVITLSVVP